MCECPATVNLSTVSTGENDTESIDVASVCSGKPCSYNRDSNFTSHVRLQYFWYKLVTVSKFMFTCTAG